jgi:hypothetical protein
MTRTTDADNLNWYIHLFKYKDTTKIPYKALAKRLGTNQYSLIAKVGRARKHPTMAEALIQQGLITEEQLPPWAAKPRPHVLAAAAVVAEDAESLTYAAITPDIPPPSSGSQVAQVSASASPLALATTSASEAITQPYMGNVLNSSQPVIIENLDGKVIYSNGPYYPPSPIQRQIAKISAEIESQFIDDNNERKRENEKERKAREFLKNNQLSIFLAKAQAQAYPMQTFHAMMIASMTTPQVTKKDLEEFYEQVRNAVRPTSEVKKPVEPPPPKPQIKPGKYEMVKEPSYTQYDLLNGLAELKRKHDIKMSTTYKRAYPPGSQMAIFEGKPINPVLESMIRKNDEMRERFWKTGSILEY